MLFSNALTTALTPIKIGSYHWGTYGIMDVKEGSWAFPLSFFSYKLKVHNYPKNTIVFQLKHMYYQRLLCL